MPLKRNQGQRKHVPSFYRYGLYLDGDTIRWPSIAIFSIFSVLSRPIGFPRRRSE